MRPRRQVPFFQYGHCSARHHLWMTPHIDKSRLRRIAHSGLILFASCSLWRAPISTDSPPAAARSNAMNVQRSAVVHISILAQPRSVVAFLSDMENWKTWAPWVHSVARISERD
jgi:hypothetical protein